MSQQLQGARTQIRGKSSGEREILVIVDIVTLAVLQNYHHHYYHDHYVPVYHYSSYWSGPSYGWSSYSRHTLKNDKSLKIPLINNVLGGMMTLSSQVPKLKLN